MFEEQLDFKKPNNEEKDDNYFIYNQQKPNLDNNYFDDLQAAKIENKINNEFKQQSQQKPLIEQLDFLNQPNIPVFPIEKPNPLFYNKKIEQNEQKKQFKKEFNKLKKKRPKSSKITNKNKIKTNKNNKINNNYNKYNQNYKKRIDNFNQIDTSINYKNKGLFDPTLKLNELDYPFHTQKQRIEKIQKIKNYDVKYGNKLKNLEMYQNFLDAYNDQENEKNDYDLKRQKYHPTKEMIKNRKDYFNLIKNIPKPKKINYNKINLDFNFNQYENVIEALEKQIENERKLRNEINFKYLEKMKEFEDLNIKKMTKINNTQKIPKRTKSAIKIYYPNKNNSINYSKKPNTNFMQKLDKYKNKVNNIIKKTQNAPTKDEIIKNNAKNLAEEITKNLDKDINKKIIDVENKKREIINKQLNKLKYENNDLNNLKNKNNQNKNNFISIQNNNNNNNNNFNNNNFNNNFNNNYINTQNLINSKSNKNYNLNLRKILHKQIIESETTSDRNQLNKNFYDKLDKYFLSNKNIDSTKINSSSINNNKNLNIAPKKYLYKKNLNFKLTKNTTNNNIINNFNNSNNVSKNSDMKSPKDISNNSSMNSFNKAINKTTHSKYLSEYNSTKNIFHKNNNVNNKIKNNNNNLFKIKSLHEFSKFLIKNTNVLQTDKNKK